MDTRFGHLRLLYILNCRVQIFVVLRPIPLPFIGALRNATFQQDNARSHVAGIVRAFIDIENIRLLPWPARFLDLLLMENVWSIVAK